MSKWEKKVMLEAMEKWGAKAQIMMLFEEIGELMQAIGKLDRVKDIEEAPARLADVAEEIADVQIMLDQMVLLFDARDAVAEYRNAKMLRLERRLNGG